MRKFTKSALAAAVALGLAQSASAGTAPFFIPLTKGEIVEPADSVDERNAPWSAPAGVSWTNLTSMEEIEADVSQSIVRVAADQNSSMFDMLAYDPSGRYIFIPHETPFGAGVSRYDSQTDTSEILLMGDETGAAGFAANTDFGAFDPARWTPNGTVIAGEEWAGTGRLVEICNPLAPAPADPVTGGSELVAGDCDTDPNADWRVLDNLPLTSQEGLSFSINAPDEVLYFIDENNTGSIYKAVFTNPGKYNAGAVTYVLVVDGYNGDASKNWNDASNAGQPRTGTATWVPITDATGAPLAGVTDPRVPSGAPGLSGRLAADDVGGTPYGRPEDTTIAIAASGNEMLYFTATSENSVYSVEETPTGPVVRTFVSPSTPKNLGFAPTTAGLNSPDNLALDSLGNIYVIEDSPNTTTVGADGGDVWFARDTDNDGVAESIDHFLSLQVNQSEATGMIFHPVDGTKFVVAVQHPASTDLADVDNDGVRDSDGFGDAIWEFDLTNVAPPECVGPRSDWMTFNTKTNRWVRACSAQRDFNVVEQLSDSEQPGDYPAP